MNAQDDLDVDCARQSCCACSQDGSDEAAISVFVASGVKAPDRRPGQSAGADPSAAVDSVSTRSEALFDSGMYCAESVLQAVAEAHGQQDPVIPRIATGFCGGISRTSGMCGALAGGIMALGLLTGRSVPKDSKDRCYALVHSLVQRFHQRFGSTRCTDLLGCDISTAEGSRCFGERGLAESVCAPITRQAAGLVEEVFALRGQIRHPLL